MPGNTETVDSRRYLPSFLVSYALSPVCGTFQEIEEEEEETALWVITVQLELLFLSLIPRS